MAGLRVDELNISTRCRHWAKGFIAAMPLAVISMSCGGKHERHGRLAKRGAGLTDDLGGVLGLGRDLSNLLYPLNDPPAWVNWLITNNFRRKHATSFSDWRCGHPVFCLLKSKLGVIEMLRLITIAVVCTLFLIPIAGYSSNIISSAPLLIAVTFTLGYVVLPVLLLRLWPETAHGEKEKSMQDALWDGELDMDEHVIREAAQIEEMEDEGPHFLLATSTGQTLCLSGQYLYGPVERGSFPSGTVRIYRNNRSGATYGIEAVGPRLDQWQTYDPFTVEQARSEVIEDGKVYSEPLAELIRKLGLQPQPEAA